MGTRAEVSWCNYRMGPKSGEEPSGTAGRGTYGPGTPREGRSSPRNEAKTEEAALGGLFTRSALRADSLVGRLGAAERLCEDFGGIDGREDRRADIRHVRGSPWELGQVPPLDGAPCLNYRTLGARL